MSDVTASYGALSDFIVFFLGIFTHNWLLFMPKWVYLHQTFTECVSYQYTNFDVSTCQMWLQVMERSLILLCFLGIFTHNLLLFISKWVYLHQTFTKYVSHEYTHFGISTSQIWLQVMERSLILLCFFLGIFLHRADF